MKDAAIRAFLNELYETGQHNDARENERSKKMLNLEPETAHFLHILMRSTRRVILPVGKDLSVAYRSAEE